MEIKRNKVDWFFVILWGLGAGLSIFNEQYILAILPIGIACYHLYGHYGRLESLSKQNSEEK